MAKVKTRDRIKTTALALFNNEGERSVSASDIAAVMEISPGNLHYHFSSKGLIIKALFEDFEDEIRQVLSAPVTEPLAIEDNWVFLYIIFEEIWDFRFFYKNLESILAIHTDLAAPFSRILGLKTRTFKTLMDGLEGGGYLQFASDEKTALAERLTMHFTYWLQYHALRYPAASPKTLINHGVYTALVQIVPYWSAGRDGFAELLSDFLKTQE